MTQCPYPTGVFSHCQHLELEVKLMTWSSASPEGTEVLMSSTSWMQLMVWLLSPQRCKLLPLPFSWRCESQHCHRIAPGPGDTHVFCLLGAAGGAGHNLDSASSQSRELLALLALWTEWVGGVGHHTDTEVFTSF